MYKKLSEMEIQSMVETLRQIFNQQGRVTMSQRYKVAEQYGCSLATVSNYVTKLNMTHCHTWQEEELKDVWCNYEAVGAQALAEKYGVTTKAIIQQVSIMRRVPHDVQMPWCR